jgi:murein DD-endopeptidase MepM/ murein hydrolase activator NlpD
MEYDEGVRWIVILLSAAMLSLAAPRPAPKRPVTPSTRTTAKARYYRRPTPVQIPANYIVRPQLADLPELTVPLEGLRPEELTDSFAYRRPDGLVHWGIDIFRTAGEPVFAVTDGYVRLNDNPLGGTTATVISESREFRFYYAHLEGYFAGLRDGAHVRQGEVIGYVGNTGNARGTRAHLHFEVHVLAPWMMDEIGQIPKAGVLNPCPILRDLVSRQAVAAAAE